jgi:hypothetical protein
MTAIIDEIAAMARVVIENLAAMGILVAERIIDCLLACLP